MTPSLPGFVPSVGCRLIEIADSLDCAMLRFGLPCGNSAYYVIVCPTGRGDEYRLIPFCQMCVDDSDDNWLSSLEKTTSPLTEEQPIIIRPRQKV